MDWLQACSVCRLIDIRRHPGSRRLPQFNQGNLRKSLATAGIDYLWYGEALGGRREAPQQDDAFTGLPEGALRAFAVYMNTSAFRSAIDECLQLAAHEITTIMCAERDPAHCHRQLISDYLCLQGHDIRHIVGRAETSTHGVNPAARLSEGYIYYDRGTQQGLGI